MNRRRTLELVGIGLSAGLAGCSVLGDDGTDFEHEQTVDLANSQHSAATFRDVVSVTNDQYGTSGVWGTDAGRTQESPPFQAAWAAVITHDDGAQSRHVLAVYRLPEAADGTKSSQVWLWSGVEPADGGQVRTVRSGVSLPESASLGIYSPAQDYQAADVDVYTVESGRLDAETLSATMPIESGTVGVGEGTRIGDGGAYYPHWQGEAPETRSFAATTEVRWRDAEDRTLTWELAVEPA